MQQFPRLDRLPNKSLEGGIEQANRLYFSITWEEHAGVWSVWSGEDLIYRSDSQEATEAFLYGTGLAYARIPDFLFNYLVYGMKRLVNPADITPAERAHYEGGGESK
jgi:hypothetical protein